MKLLPRPHPLALMVRLLGLALLTILSLPARAEIPAPDNLLYGTINLGGTAITASDWSYVVEARRTPTGAAVASYQMGSDPAAGNFYSLRLPLEQQAPRQNPAASLAGESLYLVVQNDAVTQTQVVYQVAAPGSVQRLDIGAPAFDSDGDGLPDGWELAWLGGLGQNGSQDTDGDLQSNLAEYLAGTNPANPNDAFRLSIVATGQRPQVTFLARVATGAGYEGRARYYTLQSSTNLHAGLWSAVPNYTNLPGTNQTITYPVPTNPVPSFFRARVTLVGP